MVGTARVCWEMLSGKHRLSQEDIEDIYRSGFKIEIGTIC